MPGFQPIFFKELYPSAVGHHHRPRVLADYGEGCFAYDFLSPRNFTIHGRVKPAIPCAFQTIVPLAGASC